MEEFAELAIKEAKKLGAKYSEARIEKISENSFTLNNGIVEASGFEDHTGLGVRLLVNNTWGFASTNSFDSAIIKRAVRRAFDVASLAKKSTSTRISDETPNKVSYKVKQRKNVLNVSPEEKIGFLKNLDDSLIKSKAKFAGRYFSLSDGVAHKVFLNSEGSRIISDIPRIFLYYLFTVKGNSKSQQRYWECAAAGGWEFADKWKLQKILPEEAKALLNVMKKGVKVPGKPLTVITGPQVSGIIAHESCGHPFETDRIFGREAAQAGESWITPAMLGRSRLGTEAVNLVDDPNIENAYGFYKYDDEGVRARKRYLVKAGIVNEFYHNRETAGTMSVKSNGSARASEYDKEPLVRMGNTYFEPGKQSEKELIESARLGVYFKSFTEWNIDDRRYNNRYVSSEAHLIENGRVTKPLKNVVFELTTPKIYSSIEAVGKNFELHPGVCGKGEPMQGMPVAMGGGSLKLVNIKLR